MSGLRPVSSVRIDLRNPGQFFACCGLLELADRIAPGTQGLFEGKSFSLVSTGTTATAGVKEITEALLGCTLSNTMTAEQVRRFDELSMGKNGGQERTVASLDEKKHLEKLRREEPLLLHEPFRLRLDWFQDSNAGGSRFKTWAGQQSVLDIALSMKQAMELTDWRTGAPEEWMSKSVGGCGLPFNFDSDLGGQGSALDIGFSLDPLAASAATRIDTNARPFLELLAFIGLQRFRPRLMRENRYLYCTWNHPLPPELAAVAACGMLPSAVAAAFEFRLLHRTQYLKSFLPAIPYSGDSSE
ncbi:MAG: type I-U CRISPR-associated protein Cas8c [Steroidobacteraceae bacterium]